MRHGLWGILCTQCREGNDRRKADQQISVFVLRRKLILKKINKIMNTTSPKTGHDNDELFFPPKQHWQGRSILHTPTQINARGDI